MTNDDAIRWLDNLTHDIGNTTHQSLWHYAQALAEITELLQEQEARVLTLEEVLGGDECWVEYINGGCGYCDCYLDDDAKSIVINRTLRKDFNVSPNGYGKVWRCWSVRPTDEQRKAVKWDENP